MAEWETPKTDWNADYDGTSYVGDYYNYGDYNRQKNNLMYLLDYARPMYEVTDYDLGDDKSVSDIAYADEMNAIENALISLAKDTDTEVDDSKTWKANGYVPTYEDYNRIESGTFHLYKQLVAQKTAQRRLAFRLGDQKGIKA